ncbi:MAG: collagen binding domain-containing protein [Candidatus Sulfotelmatobacter sp.]
MGQLGDPKGTHTSVTTAPDGTFHASVRWPGDYIYGVSLGILLCQGRVQPPYWQRGRTLSFARGEQKIGAVFEVEGGGVLQGVLQNQSGGGVAKGDVTLTQRVRVGAKTYRWFAVGSIQADENGHYGFCNVPEGEYFVNSQGTMRTFGDKTNTEPLPKDYVRTFYPNVLDEDASQPVHITAGGVKKLNLVLREAPTHRVQGHVVFPSGRSLLQPFVVLSHLDAGNSTYIGYHAPVNRSGSFDLAGIPPGKYRLTVVADSGERELRKTPTELEIKKEWRATSQIEIKDSDVIKEDLTLTPNGRVSGQFRDNRGEIFRPGNLVLTLVSDDGRILTRTVEDGRELPLDPLEIEPDGHFVLHELPPGKYRIGWLGQMSIMRLATGVAAIYLAGGEIAGHDVLRDGFEVKAGQEISDASIVIATGPGGIKAKVRDETGKPRSRAVVLVVPAEEMKMQWHRYQSGCSYPTGDAYVNDIPPGDYRVFAMESPPVTHYIEPWSCGSQEKPRWEDLKIYEKDSALIHIVPGKTNELDLRLIRAR